MVNKSEWGKLTKVLIHRPGLEIEYAMLSPRSFLFERPFNTAKAREEHDKLEDALKSEGVEVLQLRRLFIDLAKKHQDFRRALEKRVTDNVMFFGEVEDVSRARRDFERIVNELDSSTLFEILTLEPSLDLRKLSEGITYPTVYSNIPLANLYFMRDQQAVLPKGILVGNMKNPQRKKEVEITSFLFDKGLKQENSFAITGTGILEGGDYIPMGKFALFGTGSRSNIEGVKQALSSGLLEYDTVYAVENPVYDFMENASDPMVNMHLDTYFNVASSGSVVTSKTLCERANVRVFHKNGGEYQEDGKTTLLQVVRDNGFEIIALSVAEQLSYASNFLTIGDGKILAIETGKVLERLLKINAYHGSTLDAVKIDFAKSGGKNTFPDRKDMKEHGIDFIPLDLQELTGGYGGAHCMTASLARN